MNKHTLFATLLCLLGLVSTATAGEATTKKTFISPLKFPKELAVWYPSHRAGILKAANSEITKSGGKNTYHVKSKTPIGTWHYVVRETLKSDSKQASIQYTLVDRLKTKLSKQVVTITIRPVNNGTAVTMKMVQQVKSAGIPSFALRSSQNASIAGVKKFLSRIKR